MKKCRPSELQKFGKVEKRENFQTYIKLDQIKKLSFTGSPLIFDF